MKCPNCNATDHELGAKYCHKCGSLLVSNNSCSIERPKQQNRYNLSSAPVGVEAIDLGLPSGTKWANMNMGATSPEEYGSYYAWGETEEKKVYDRSTYIYCDGTYDTYHNLGSDISGTQYDVAHVKWGGNWRMPTIEQIWELLLHSKQEWTELNGVAGTRFKSKINGNSIFLPAAGFRSNHDGLDDARRVGYYRSSTQSMSHSDCAHTQGFYSVSTGWSCENRRDLGCTVRPVTR